MILIYLQRVILVFALSTAMILPFQIITAPPAAYGAELLTITAPVAKDPSGRFVEQVNAGEMVILLMTVLGGGAADQPFTAIIDTRDNQDMSVHIAWVQGIAQQKGYSDVALPWSADEAGDYTIRTFIITGFDNLEVLSQVKSSPIKVSISARADISGIVNFATKWDEVNYVAYFSLLDTKGNEATYDGKATLSISDATEEVRYVSSVEVTKDDFRPYSREWGDELKILAYVWDFPASTVNKGVGQGTAKLTFSANDGSIFTASTPIELRQLSGVEIIKEYESIYQRYGTDVDQTAVEGNFKVTLKTIGHFTHLAGGTFGEEVTHFRADYTITNLSSEKLPGPVRLYVVDDKSIQYNEVQYNWTLQSGMEIDAFTTVSGYKLFEDLREDASWIKIVMVGLNNPEDVLEMNAILK